LRATVQGQSAQQAYNFLFGVGQPVHEFGEIVFEKFLTALLKERNEFPVIRSIGAHESEIELRVALVDRYAPEAVSDGAVQGTSWKNSEAHRTFIQEKSGISPLGRVARADDVAQTVAFLASPESDYLTAVDLVVAGGAEIF